MASSDLDTLVTKFGRQLRLERLLDDANGRALLMNSAESAKAVVDAYAPNAPEAIANEAVVRLASWLFDGLGTVNDAMKAPNILRASGAEALIARYRTRRGRIVGE